MKEFKIISLGDSGVGKSSIFRRYTENKFDEDTMSTIGLAFADKELTLQNKEKVKLKLVDTGGQERYKSLAKNYYKNADGVIFVFSHNDKDSFDHIIDWIELFDQNTTNKEIPKFLIGNKNDLKKFDEEDSFDDFIKDHNILRYISTSAKDNINITEIFKDLAETIFKSYQRPFKQFQICPESEKKIENRWKKRFNNCCPSTDV